MCNDSFQNRVPSRIFWKKCSRNLSDLNSFLELIASNRYSYIFAALFRGNVTAKKGLKFWEISSAGSEHLVYTEGVGGSNPSSPT